MHKCARVPAYLHVCSACAFLSLNAECACVCVCVYMYVSGRVCVLPPRPVEGFLSLTPPHM